MTARKRLNGRVVEIVKDDITAMQVDALVFYASSDLKLGTGYGNAIAQRGGPTIQEELDRIGRIETGEAVTTGGGNLKVRYVIHAVGPRFQEDETEGKLRSTTLSALRQAEQNGVRRLALPPMGTGFYGVPLEVSARVTLGAIKDHLDGESGLEEVIICARDTREIGPFETALHSLT